MVAIMVYCLPPEQCALTLKRHAVMRLRSIQSCEPAHRFMLARVVALAEHCMGAVIRSDPGRSRSDPGQINMMCQHQDDDRGLAGSRLRVKMAEGCFRAHIIRVWLPRLASKRKSRKRELCFIPPRSSVARKGASPSCGAFYTPSRNPVAHEDWLGWRPHWVHVRLPRSSHAETLRV